MASIAIIGDVHADYGRLAASLDLLNGSRFDLAVLTGDIGVDLPRGAEVRSRHEHDASIERVLAAVRQTLDCPVVFVPGNHDLRDPQPPPGAVNVDGTTVEVAGLTVAGLGGAGPAFFGFPYEWTEDQAESALQATFVEAPLPPDIFLSHTPPARSVLDRTLHGLHVGSTAVRRRIETLAPGLFVCGHIHESWGFTRIAGVPCINAGSLGPPAEQDIAWHVAWDGQPTRIEVRYRDRDGKVQTRSWE